jgi:hypothetical protein
MNRMQICGQSIGFRCALVIVSLLCGDSVTHAQQYYLSFPLQFDCSTGVTRSNTILKDQNIGLVPPDPPNSAAGAVAADQRDQRRCLALNGRLRKIYDSNEVDSIVKRAVEQARKELLDRLGLEEVIRAEHDRLLRAAIDGHLTNVAKEILRDEKLVGEIIERVVEKMRK